MPTPRRKQRIQQAVSQRQTGLVVVLEDVHDPHNAQAVMRSCDAFGVQHVYLVFEQTAAFNPRKIGRATASSANKWLNFHTFNSTESCLRELTQHGYELVATQPHPDAESVFTATLDQPKVALLFGNEHRGLSPLAIQQADCQVQIPMRGMVTSLNISVSAAIMLFAVTRQRLPNMPRYQLSSRGQDKLYKDFTQR